MTDIFCFCPICEMPRLMKSLLMLVDEKLNQVLHFQCGTCLNEIEATLYCKVKEAEITTYGKYGK